MAVLLLGLGLIGLVAGAEFLVRGSVALAYRMRISPLVVGLTVVGFGTSTPELAASVGAALSGAPGMAVGNVVGSNIANILLILGAAALVSAIATTKHAFVRDGSALIGASVILAGVCWLGAVDRITGGLLLVLLAGYVGLSLIQDRRRANAAAAVHREQGEAVHLQPSALWVSALCVVGGIAGLVAGAWALVTGAVTIARAWEVPETVIGLTIVAVGTSLPELTTSIVAGLRGQSDVAFGNVVGSNIFNILGILGVTALVSPLDIPHRIAAFDVWLMLAVTLVAVLFAVTGWRITRWEGFVLLCGYAAYIGFLFLPGGP